MTFLRLLPVAVVTAVSVAAADPKPLYLDPAQPVETRLDDLLPRLTLEEKVALVHADTQFTCPGVPRLGIPKLWMSDGPHGVREEISTNSWKPAGRTDDFCTYMPISMGLAATWDPALAKEYGATIADEARQRGKGMMLGPGLNIVRTPLNGRNFEYLGEDPWLTSRIAVADIQGLQSGQVSACAKHFALNNQEDQRGSINVEVDERTLRELYLPAFEAAVKEGGVWSIMGAYNRYLGQHCCHNEVLLNTILKGEWGFKGLVVSDWGGVHDTREAALFGMDLEMGSGHNWDEYKLGRPFREGLQAGTFPMSVLDDKVRRVLRVILSIGLVEGREPGSINTRAHQDTALRVAEASMVLLKNEHNALPLATGKIRSIAVIGANAVKLQAHSGQSSELKAFHEITPLEGLVRRLGKSVNITYSAGYYIPERRRIETTGLGGVRASIADNAPPVPEDQLLAQAELAAKNADVAIIVGGLTHDDHFDSEGSDRLNLDLPFGQEALIRRVAAANPRTVVVLLAGSPVVMDSWIQSVPSVVLAWYPGMEGGHAIASLLCGDFSPSGKLPVTFPKKLSDSPAHHSGLARNYPGEAGTVHYDEGLLVGYRWHDSKKIEPLFPFGFGLSYTTFSYGQLTAGSHLSASTATSPSLTSPFATSAASPTRAAPPTTGTATQIPPAAPSPTDVSITATITNTGTMDADEIVQVYVAPLHPSVARPPQELKGFQRVSLKAKEAKTITIPLSPRAFAYYSVEKHAWLVEAGDYEIRLAASSRDIRGTTVIHLPETTVIP